MLLYVLTCVPINENREQKIGFIFFFAFMSLEKVLFWVFEHISCRIDPVITLELTIKLSKHGQVGSHKKENFV